MMCCRETRLPGSLFQAMFYWWGAISEYCTPENPSPAYGTYPCLLVEWKNCTFLNYLILDQKFGNHEHKASE